jgi:hypothetical protein
MTRATALIGITLFIFDSPVLAQSASQIESLDACFHQSRLADKICEGQPDASARLDCFKKTRDAELECLTHITPGEPTAAMPPSRDAAPPAASASSKEPPENPRAPTGSIERAPSSTPPAPARSRKSRDVNAQPTVPKVSGTGSEAIINVQPNPRPLETSPAPSTGRWIVSETTSPIDYSPLVNAVLQSTEPRGDGPADLTIRCRAKRVELSLQFSDNSTWRDEQQIYFRAGDQSPVPLDWTWSPDGKTATLKNDPVSLLQSLPDGSTLRIWTSNRPWQQNAAFQLAGLEGVRRRVALACHWAPQQAETSSRKSRTRR